MHSFNFTDQAIDQKAPINILNHKIDKNISDVFRKQLIHTLEG